MADRWKQTAEAERKLEEKAAKNLLKLEKAQLKVARERDRLERRQRRREEEAARRDRQRQRERKRHGRRRQRRASRERPRSRRAARRQPLTATEEAYREARKRASAKIGFLTHFIIYGSVLALILVSSGNLRATFIVALSWGIGIAIHYFKKLVAPGLRDRMIEDEVGRSIAQGVTQERRAAQTRHERSLEDLSASIAHEIRNPVTAAKSLVQQMGEDPQSIENVEYAHVALEELGRVEKSISHLLKYAKEEDIELDQVRLADIVDAALTEMRAKLGQAKVAVQRNYIGGPTIIADKEKLRAVFANIFDNAIDSFGEAGGEKGDRKIELYIENGVPGRVKVRVRDNGEGIKPGEIDRIFNPFFTTKSNGTGLGMAISKKVIEAHDGSIDVSSKLGEGTEFTVALPLPERTEAA
ncbi:MAG: ATP-binding protein [Myxococcota bacterium]